MKVGFIITAFDQLREVNFTVDMLRRKWKRTANSPISIVISGDPERKLKFPHDQFTRVTTIDDIVGQDFNGLVSTSIMKQIRHGMIELEDLERIAGRVDFIVHMHGDILLLNEDGFFAELQRFADSNKGIAADTVGAHRSDYIHFEGLELMPQLFVVNRQFEEDTKFLKELFILGGSSLEKKSTEWALRENLIRRVRKYLDDWDTADKDIISNNVHVVAPGRDQWNVHKHWGGFAHFGNSLHFSQRIREARNEAALKAYGVDLSSW